MPQKLIFYGCVLLLLCCATSALAQRNIQLHGTVLQPDKQTPIGNADIHRVGTNIHTTSDSIGSFRLQILETDTLLIRAVGYKPLRYIPKRLPVSELRVTLIMQEDSVMLGEVEVTSRPSAEMIQRTMRNMNSKTTSYTKRPGHIPGLEPPPPTPAPPPTVIFNPISAFSKEGKQQRRVHKLQQEAAQKAEQQRQQEEEAKKKKAKEEYNRFFKDNTGYD